MKGLNEDIKTGNLRQIYLLCGEEEYLKKVYKEKLRNALPDIEELKQLVTSKTKLIC